jgi:hypothetical protein
MVRHSMDSSGRVALAGPRTLLETGPLAVVSAVRMRLASRAMWDMGGWLYNRQDGPVRTQGDNEGEMSNPIGSAAEGDCRRLRRAAYRVVQAVGRDGGEIIKEGDGKDQRSDGTGSGCATS